MTPIHSFKLADYTIGSGSPCFMIAEVAQGHEGSLGMAHAYIDAVAEVGVDAIKFQTHIADAESTLDEPFRVKFSRQDSTRYGYWKRMEFTFEQWQGLANHCRDKEIIFLSSPFSTKAVELLKKLDVPAWKIGSGETVTGDILDAVLTTKRPVLVSTGMSTYLEIDNLVGKLRSSQASFGLFQCTSKYPVMLAEVGLNVIQEIKARYGCPVGLSDHSGNLFPTLAAMAQGVDIIEAHIVFDKRMFGPDTPASLTVEDFKTLVQARNAFYTINANPVDKNHMAEAMSSMRDMFGKSLALTQSLTAGTVLTEEVLTAKKPGTGIALDKKSTIIGKTLRRAVDQNRLLRWEDIDE